MREEIISGAAKTNAVILTGSTGTQLFGLTLSDMSYIVIMGCAIVTTIIAVLTYFRKTKKGD